MNETMNETVSDTWMWLREVMGSWLEDPGEEHQGLNMGELKMDEAYMIGVADRDVGIYSVSDDCFRVSAADILHTLPSSFKCALGLNFDNK